MTTLPQAVVSHQTRNRIRIRIPHCQRDREYFARLRDELSKCEGIERVEANPSTASVLIHHCSSSDRIAEFAEAAELFALAVEDTPLAPSSLASRVNERVVELNQRVISASRGALDITSISAFGLAVGGVLKGLFGKSFLPSGSDMIWWAVTLLARHDARARGAEMASSPPRATAARPSSRAQTARSRVRRSRKQQ